MQCHHQSTVRNKGSLPYKLYMASCWSLTAFSIIYKCEPNRKAKELSRKLLHPLYWNGWIKRRRRYKKQKKKKREKRNHCWSYHSAAYYNVTKSLNVIPVGINNLLLAKLMLILNWIPITSFNEETSRLCSELVMHIVQLLHYLNNPILLHNYSATLDMVPDYIKNTDYIIHTRAHTHTHWPVLKVRLPCFIRLNYHIGNLVYDY